MSDIEFGVIDLSCEATDQSFFPPQISLVTRSSSRQGQIIGFPSLDGSLHRYRTVTYIGYSEQQLWYKAGMIGAARYDYSGADSMDMFGKNLSNHSKLLSVLCDGDPNGQFAEIQGNDAFGQSVATSFKGYWGVQGIPALLGHPTTLCATASVPYIQSGDKAARGPFDFSDLWGSALVPGTVNIGLSKVTVNGPDSAQSVESGSDVRLLMQYLPLKNSIPTGQLPPDFWVQSLVKFDNNYQIFLTDEFTEFDALTVAIQVSGNGNTAANLRNGFSLSVTTVSFTLNCTNLVNGTAYKVSYDLWNQTLGLVNTFSLSFVANGTTHAISGNVPLPARGQAITIRNPKISFLS